MFWNLKRKMLNKTNLKQTQIGGGAGWMVSWKGFYVGLSWMAYKFDTLLKKQSTYTIVANMNFK